MDFKSVEGGEYNPPGVWRILHRDGSATIRQWDMEFSPL